jgi:hypothetical protein
LICQIRAAGPFGGPAAGYFALFLGINFCALDRLTNPLAIIQAAPWEAPPTAANVGKSFVFSKACLQARGLARGLIPPAAATHACMRARDAASQSA